MYRIGDKQMGKTFQLTISDELDKQLEALKKVYNLKNRQEVVRYVLAGALAKPIKEAEQ